MLPPTWVLSYRNYLFQVIRQTADWIFEVRADGGGGGADGYNAQDDKQDGTTRHLNHFSVFSHGAVSRTERQFVNCTLCMHKAIKSKCSEDLKH